MFYKSTIPKVDQNIQYISQQFAFKNTNRKGKTQWSKINDTRRIPNLLREKEICTDSVEKFTLSTNDKHDYHHITPLHSTSLISKWQIDSVLLDYCLKLF
jgi:hypothetical protein